MIVRNGVLEDPDTFMPFSDDNDIDNTLLYLDNLITNRLPNVSSEEASSFRDSINKLEAEFREFKYILYNTTEKKSRFNLKNALRNVKIDFLNIRNPKVFDAEGRDWRHVTRKNKSNKQAYQEFLEILDKVDPKEILRHIGVSAHTNVANWSTQELQH